MVSGSPSLCTFLTALNNDTNCWAHGTTEFTRGFTRASTGKGSWSTPPTLHLLGKYASGFCLLAPNPQLFPRLVSFPRQEQHSRNAHCAAAQLQASPMC